MTEPISERQEQEYAERFNNGQKPTTAVEADVHESYRKLDTALRTLTVQEVDRSQLAARMASEAELGRRSTRSNGGRFGWGFLERLPSPAFAVVCTVMICGLALAYLRLLQVPGTPLAHSFSLLDLSSEKAVDASLFWGFHLRRGHTVTVPEGHEARLELADGSHVRCVPDTCLALSEASQRRIHLENGTVFITAKPGLERPLQVVSDLGTVEVTGTEFRVSVTR